MQEFLRFLQKYVKINLLTLKKECVILLFVECSLEKGEKIWTVKQKF